ncbi:MAG TPA: hypothetical protein VFC63_09995 [Blastocatellia bacterium]|nr:hypothetical protein [Blastocatellia bacterium]
MKSYLFIILVLVFVVSFASAQERPKPSRAIPNPNDSKPQRTPGANAAQQPTKDQVPVPEAISKQLAANASGNCPNSLTARSVNIDQSGTPGFLVTAHSDCSCINGNCATWLYRENGDRYDLLFNAGNVLGVTVGQTTTNGYRDLMTEAYSAPSETLMSFYKWDGNKYVATECMIHKRIADRFGRPIYKNLKVNCQTKQMNRP